MLFDKAKVLELVRMGMPETDKRKTAMQEMALGAALDDLALRLRPKSFLTSYDEALLSGVRELELSGQNDDLREIFAIRVGTGDKFRILEYKTPQDFLATFETTDSGYPAYFTVLTGSVDGFPLVRFDVQAAQQETMTVYYHMDMTPDNVALAKSISAIAAGTIAYFYGTKSEVGAPYYEQFKELATLTRETNTFVNKPILDVPLNDQERSVMETLREIRRSRG